MSLSTVAFLPHRTLQNCFGFGGRGGPDKDHRVNVLGYAIIGKFCENFLEGSTFNYAADNFVDYCHRFTGRLRVLRSLDGQLVELLLLEHCKGVSTQYGKEPFLYHFKVTIPWW